jgi:hypothetical protein
VTRAAPPVGVELRVVLDRAQAENDACDRHERRPVGGKGLLSRHGHVVGLEGDGTLREPCQPVAEPGEKVAVGLDNLVDLLHRARGLGVASVGNEKDPVTVDENS